MFGNPDRRRRLTVILVAALLAVSGRLSAQLPIQAPAAAPAPVKSDPLGRESPFGTVSGFSSAVRRHDFAVAGRFLLVSGQSPEEVESLARDLSDLLDRYFTHALTSLSASPQGDLADGLEPERERLMLSIGDQSEDMFLTRITDPDVGPIWLFAPESLAKVPALHSVQQETWVEGVMPETLVEHSYLGISLAQTILWAASILIPLLVFWSLTMLVAAVARWRIANITRRTVFLTWWKGVRWLLILGATLIAHLLTMRRLGFGLSFRVTYARVGLFVAIVIGALLTWRLVSVTFHQARVLALRRGRADTRSIILLSERVVKVMVIVIAVIGLLTLAGMDPATALAGLGIVGVAVALGAQKSVENLLGGIFLLTDRVLAVGDYCRLSDREGWIEDITLRSVRLRTLEQTLLSVPAGNLAQGNIENYANRAKILLRSTLRLRYGTTATQLQSVLDGIEGLLAKHPLVEQESARIRLVAFGERAIELELFTYVLTAEFEQFLVVRQSLLLQVAGLVESSGSGFAGPTEFIHMGADAPGIRPVPANLG